MRCLYCGKELALLKRLTGGAEFCSDAHRKSYQSEYNDLALSRLLQAKQPTPPPAKRSAKTEPAPEPGSAVAVADIETLPAPPEPQPAEIIAAMWGPVIEQPVAAVPELAPITGAEPQMDSTLTPALPTRNLDTQQLAQEYGLLWANPVTWTPPLHSGAGSFQTKQRALEVRDFSRGKISPAPPKRRTLDAAHNEFSNSVGDAMEISNQPRPPAAPPQIWQAGPLAHASVEVAMGALGVVDFSAMGFEREVTQQDATVDAPRVQAPPPPRVVEPVAVTPVPTPVVEVSVPRVSAPAEPVTRPLPVTLHGIGAAAPATPTATASAIATSFEPKTPGSSTLPLRPMMVLGPAAPKPVAVQSEPAAPKPEATAPKVVETPVPAVRVLRSSGKKRSDVRVIPAAPAPKPSSEAPVPVAAAAPPPPAPEAPKPVAEPVAVQPVAVAPPAAIEETAPLAVPPPTSRTSSSARSTLVPADTLPAREEEVDLKLPELHLQEMQQGMWARMPAAVKMVAAAAIVLSIVGFAYFALNSNTASATSVSKAPAYKLGQQINSGGWIEDWAPADPLRRVTLLRGSQPFSDYRIELSAQIQKKAVGWMYRGINPKNYYVAKLEKLSSGIEPVVALVRYAVIDGKNEGRVETLLPMKVRVDTLYKVRFDAVGPNFTVWVQGQQVAQWRDTRLGSGGLGLYAEGDEAAVIQGNVDVFELTSGK